jgi:hypothetical protein
MSLILLISSLVVAALVVVLLFRVVRAALGTALTLAFVLLVLQFAFGISVDDLLRELLKLWSSLERAI